MENIKIDLKIGGKGMNWNILAQGKKRQAPLNTVKKPSGSTQHNEHLY
jgi:hypothetical protein